MGSHPHPAVLMEGAPPLWVPPHNTPSLGVPGTYRNGAPQFPRGDGHAKRDTYTTPQKQARAPPATALPPQNASRRSKARPPSEQNMEFLNVPDQGVAG